MGRIFQTYRDLRQVFEGTLSPSVGYQPLSSLNGVGTLLGTGSLLLADRAPITGQLEEARDAMVRDAALMVDLEAIEALGIGVAYLRPTGGRVLLLSVRSRDFLEIS